jgi:hypothetical protein
MEAHPKEKKPTSPNRKPEAAENREVPKENAEVIPVGKLRKKRGKVRKLAVELRRQMKEWTQCQDGYQGRLAVARRGTSHRATVARQKQKRNDTRMSSRATVALLKRDILRNTTHKKCGAHKRLGFGNKNWARDSVRRGTVTGQTSAAMRA